MGQALHSYEYPARPLVWFPAVDMGRKSSPSPQIEVANAKVRPRRRSEGTLQSGEKPGVSFKVVEDSWHGYPYSLPSATNSPFTPRGRYRRLLVSSPRWDWLTCGSVRVEVTRKWCERRDSNPDKVSEGLREGGLSMAVL